MRFGRNLQMSWAMRLGVLAIVALVTASAFLLAEAREALSATSQEEAATGARDIFHVAIFRFPKEHVNDARHAFGALASASRRESGNLRYDIYRGLDDDQEFYVVEHWASPEALAVHESSEAFIRYGVGVLVKYATLHDTVTSRPFDVGGSSPD